MSESYELFPEYNGPEPILHSVEMEMSVLGSMMLGDDAPKIVRSILPSPEMFYRPSHRRIYHVLCKLMDDGPHLRTALDVVGTIGAGPVEDDEESLRVGGQGRRERAPGELGPVEPDHDDGRHAGTTPAVRGVSRAGSRRGTAASTATARGTAMVRSTIPGKVAPTTTNTQVR